MKKFTQLFALLLISLYSLAQNQVVPTLGNVRTANPSQVQQIKQNHLQQQAGSSRALQNIEVNYGLVEDSITRQLGDSVKVNTWELNSRWPDNTANSFRLKWAYIAYDSLYNYRTMQGVPYSTTPPVKVDSLAITLRHTNITGNNDTLIIRVYNLPVAGPSINVSNNITDAILWSDTIVVNTSISPIDFADLRFFPNLTLAANQRFGVGVFYSGDTSNTFELLGVYSDRCPTSCIAYPSIVPDNNFYNIILWNGATSLSGAYASSDLFFDCDASGGFTAANCESFYIQSFLVSAYLTVDIASGIPAPVANFTGTPTTLTAGGSVAFTDLSTNTPTSWSWSFPGGTPSTSTIRNPTITYNTPGTYSVTLTATNAGGNNTFTRTNYITVNSAGGGGTCDSLSHYFVGDTLGLIGSSNGGYIAGHNGYGDRAKAEKFSNANPGYQVTEADYYFGDAMTNNPASFITATVWSNNPATGLPATVLGSETVLITQIISDINDTLPTTVVFNPPITVQDTFFIGWTMTYANGDTVGIITAGSSNAARPNYAYEQFSNNSWFSFTDAANSWDLDLSLLIFPIVCPQAAPAAPVADFTANQTTITVGGNVNFTDLSTNSPTAWSWSFPGGTPSSSTAQNPTNIVYNTAGVYPVTLTASNAGGADTETKTAYITVNAVAAAPVADFTANQTTVTAGGSVNFTDLSTNTPTSWQWTFNGGTPGTSTQRNPSNIVYNTPGTYTVSLVATNATGSDTETKVNYITVTAGNNTYLDCDTFINFDVALANPDTIRLVNTGTWGFISGHNNFGDAAKAELFGNPNPGTPISQAFLLFAVARFNSPTDSVTVSLWDANGTGGAPGTVLASRRVAYSTIAADVAAFRFTTVNFPTNPNPTGDFYIGVSFAYSAGDTIALYHTTDGDIAAGSGTAWELWNTGAWFPYNDPNNSWGLDVSHYIAFQQCVTVTCPTISATSNVTNATCTAANGSATVTGTGGVTPYTFRWGTSPIQTTATASNLTAGSYIVTVTDANGCTGTSSVVIGTNNSTILPNISTTPAVCASTNGTATAAPSGGTAPYNYLWSTNQTTASISALAAGTYTVTITDANGCTTTGTATVTASSGNLSATTATTPATCASATGTATVSVTGGTAPFTYAWSNNQTTSTISNVVAGTYTVSVTDANGCSLTRTATISSTSGTIAVGATATNATCAQSNGTATATVTGATGTATYLWSNNQTTATISGLAAGTYTVTVTDANGCSATASTTVSSPSTPVVTVTNQTNVNCFGTNTGSISVAVTGGSSPYTYLWSNGGNSSTVSNLAAGSYILTLTDAAGCSVTTTRTITQPASALQAAITASTPLSCAGSNNGTITVNATGGTSGYSFAWNTSPVQTNATATGLAAGNYTVTVTDANGCTTTASGTVGAPSNPVTVSVNTDQTSGCGIADGSLTATASNGASPYTFTWNTSPVQNGAVANNLSGGVYTVTVTDAGGCTASGSGTVTEPAPHTASASATPVTCYGGNNGTVNVTVVGGGGNYTYSWSPIANSTSGATGLSAGVYNITVLDNLSGCNAFATATVNQPDSIDIDISSTNVTCFGGNNGVASATVSGGTPGYTYQWLTAPIQTTSAITGLSAGSIILNVTDNAGCQASTTVVITQPVAVGGTISRTNVTCNGLNNGIASIVGTGGTPGYTYLWNTTPQQSGANLSGLAPGSYTVTITDANGCTGTQSTSITQPNALNLTVNGTNVTCNGLSTGAALANATGGTGTIAYAWNTVPAQNNANATGLAAGTYVVTATDANNCSATATVTITQPTALVATANAQAASCNGAGDGAVFATASGGTGTINFSWNTVPPTANDTALNLATGNYTVVATDANGCTATATASVTQPSNITANPSVNNVDCNGGSDGGITLNVSGGNGGFTFEWSDNSTSQNLSNVEAGTYGVTVTDANGCTAQLTGLNVTEPDAIDLTMSSTPETSVGLGGTASVVATGGTGIISYDWSNGQSSSLIINLTAGTYTVTVSDANGCSAVDSVLVDEFVGIAEIAPIRFELYPNPTTGNVTIRFELAKADDLKLEWYNVLGEKISEEQFTAVSRINQQFDLSAQAAGVYFAKISYAGSSVVKRVTLSK
ncbi:MAG: PKD domain-containing protein [Chitinophagales bacterium]|nr:PKD domain-containing protein [Chitinophagales bacterium]